MPGLADLIANQQAGGPALYASLRNPGGEEQGGAKAGGWAGGGMGGGAGAAGGASGGAGGMMGGMGGMLGGLMGQGKEEKPPPAPMAEAEQSLMDKAAERQAIIKGQQDMAARMQAIADGQHAQDYTQGQMYRGPAVVY